MNKFRHQLSKKTRSIRSRAPSISSGVPKIDSIPLWYQLKHMISLKNFKLIFFKMKLNLEINLEYQKRKNRKFQKILINKEILQYFLNISYLKYKAEALSLKTTGLPHPQLLKERIWKQEISRLIYDLKQLCRILNQKLEFRIFGGIINKIINPTFNLLEHDIDIFLVLNDNDNNNMNIPPILFNNFREALKNSEILVNIREPTDSESYHDNYGRIHNRPGINGLQHLKAKRLFIKLNLLIDVDILSGPPNRIGVDCNISNYVYNPYRETLQLIKPHNNLLGTMIDNRHKYAKLFFPRMISGIDNFNQIILLKSRQDKYERQNWLLQNKFRFPEVPDKKWECAICYEANCSNTDSQDIITLECNHIFCKSCLTLMSNSPSLDSKNNCPLCRRRLKVDIKIDQMKDDNPFYITH